MGADTALQDPDLQSLVPQLVVPAAHPGCQIGAVPGLVTEEPGRFQPRQDRRTLFDHHGLKIALHGRSPSFVLQFSLKGSPAVPHSIHAVRYS